MNKSVVIGIVIGVVIASAGAVVANYAANERFAAGEGEASGLGELFSFAEPEPAFARVLAVTPVVETERVPREVCEQVQVTERAPVRDERKLVGTVAGALIGGALGNQVGGGSGKKVATVAGAVAGGYAGNKVQENIQNRNVATRSETRCNTVYDTNEVVRGYDVAYRLGDREDSVRMSYDPGDQIPVQDGELQIR